MSKNVCYRKGYEKGAWFAIQSIKESILIGEALSKDKSFERELLKSWANYKGWEDAAKPFSQA